MTNPPSIETLKQIVLNKTKTTRSAGDGLTLEQIESSTGGIDTTLLEDDKIYLETVNGTEIEPRVTTIGEISNYTISTINTNLEGTEVVIDALPSDLLYLKRDNNGALETKGVTIEEIGNYTISTLNTNLDNTQVTLAPSPNDLLFVRRDNNGVPETKNMKIETLSNYIGASIGGGGEGTLTPTSNMMKIIEITEGTSAFEVDLLPYTGYNKFHIKFPSSRTSKDITVNITGIAIRSVPIETIMMSGLDEASTPTLKGKEFLPLEMRGTVTFTLDTQDYEFPELIYHFGTFATGGYPERIFLHIDFEEGDSQSGKKYVINDGIYALSEVWNLVMGITLGVSYDSCVPYPNKDQTALLLKSNAANPPASYNIKAQSIYATGNVYSIDIDFYFYTHLDYNFNMPIIDGTRLYQKGNRLIIQLLQNINGAWSPKFGLDFKADKSEQYLMFDGFLDSLGDANGVKPTDVALFQIAVFGKYLCKQSL